MFEFIRTHQRLMQIFLMLLIVPSFVLVGISGYQGFGDDANTLAKVGGEKISQQEFDGALRQQMDRYRQMMGAQFDPKMVDTPSARQELLNQLIGQHAIDAEVKHAKLAVSDLTLKKNISESIAQVPGLVDAKGNVDIARYKALLAAQGMTPDMYDARVRQQLAEQQLIGAVQGTAFAPRAMTAHIAEVTEQEREVQDLTLPIADFIARVKVTDAMVKAFYDKNSVFFAVPEQAKVEYVVFDAAAVADQVTVGDAEVAAYYQQNQKRFTAGESRRASHILIAVKKDASAADKAAAKAKAEAVLAEVRRAPADFAKIAKAQSQDPASAELGGDLDVVEKGALPKPVEDAIYNLKQGEISNVVASEFGYHILTVTALKPAEVKPLDAVKGEIVADLKKQKSAKKYSELAEQFTNTVYEQSDSLKPVADKLGLKIQTADGVTRMPSPALGASPVNSPKFLKAIFADDALKNKRNTEAVEAAPSTLIAGRVLEYKAASKRPLAEVDAVIRQRVTQEEALKLAQKAGAEKLAAVKASGDASGFAAAKTISRVKGDGIAPAALAAVMKADTAKLPAYVGLDVPGTGYAIYRINKVQAPAAPDAAARQSMTEQIAAVVAQQEMYDYVEALKAKAKVKIVKPIATASSAAPDSNEK